MTKQIQKLKNDIVKARKELTVSNIVCTADLKQPVDIKLFNEFPHLSCNLEKYRCGYVKDNSMTGKVTIFASGKMISIGTKSLNTATKELKNAAKILKQNKFIKSYKIEPKIQNIVASTSFPPPLSIEKLAKKLPRAIYEPDQFAGIIYHIYNSVVALIFHSGKVTMVGAKNFEDLNFSYFELQKNIT